MRMVLNELSLCSNCRTMEDAQKIMQDFIENSTEMGKLLSEAGIILTKVFHNFMLMEDYSVHNWIKDNRIEKRLKDKFRSIINRCNYINEDDYWYSEFKAIKYNPETNAIGCLVAYERQDVVISLRTNELWDNCTIEGLYFNVKDDFNSDESINVTVPNISQKPHVTVFRNNIVQDICMIISSGQDLWEKKELLYPHLVFCESVKDQLMFDTEKIHIEQIMKRLQKMEDYFANFNGVFDCKKLGLDARQESESVMKNGKYMQQRIFHTPYGEDKAFFWHINFAGKYPGRIHFMPDENRKNCLIGYIGKHLPTQTFSTI